MKLWLIEQNFQSINVLVKIRLDVYSQSLKEYKIYFLSSNVLLYDFGSEFYHLIQVVSKLFESFHVFQIIIRSAGSVSDREVWRILEHAKRKRIA